VIKESQNPLISFHIIFDFLKSYNDRYWNHEGGAIIETKPEDLVEREERQSGRSGMARRARSGIEFTLM
jgi:hypothetical protein